MERARVAGILLALTALALILMYTGIAGTTGRVLCVVFAPGRLAIRDHSQRSGLLHNVLQSVTPAGSVKQ